MNESKGLIQKFAVVLTGIFFCGSFSLTSYADPAFNQNNPAVTPQKEKPVENGILPANTKEAVQSENDFLRGPLTLAGVQQKENVEDRRVSPPLLDRAQGWIRAESNSNYGIRTIFTSNCKESQCLQVLQLKNFLTGEEMTLDSRNAKMAGKFGKKWDVSPDGKQIIYEKIRWEGDSYASELVVRETNGHFVSSLTLPSGAQGILSSIAFGSNGTVVKTLFINAGKRDAHAYLFDPENEAAGFQELVLAEHNSNFAFLRTQSGPFSSLSNDLFLVNLRSGDVQKLISVSSLPPSPENPFGTHEYVMPYADVSPDGKFVIYETRDGDKPGNTVYVQSITNPADRAVIEESNFRKSETDLGAILKSLKFEGRKIMITVFTASPNALLEKTYTFGTKTRQLSKPTARIIQEGGGLFLYPEIKLAIGMQRYQVDIYQMKDSKNLVLIRSIHFESDVQPLDSGYAADPSVYQIPGTKLQFVSVGFEFQTFSPFPSDKNFTKVVNLKTGRELRIPGAMQSVIYSGEVAAYQMKAAFGAVTEVKVNLKTLKVIP